MKLVDSRSFLDAVGPHLEIARYIDRDLLRYGTTPTFLFSYGTAPTFLYNYGTTPTFLYNYGTTPTLRIYNEADPLEYPCSACPLLHMLTNDMHGWARTASSVLPPSCHCVVSSDVHAHTPTAPQPSRNRRLISRGWTT